MKAKNIAILLFSAVIGCAVAKTYSSLKEEGGRTTDVRKERKTNVKKDVVSESEPTVEHETESVQTEVAKPSYGEYASLQKSGVVGLYGGNSIDNPEDNIFEVVIPSSFSSSDKVVLSYDVEGVAGSTGVALSINDRTAMGGMVAYWSDIRSSVSEEIDAAWLVKGKNRIMFTLPDSANYGYRVSNLKIAISANTASGNIVATASKLDGEVYVRGFVKNAKAKSVNIAGKEYELTHGSFEALISGDDEDVRITYGDASKTFHATTVSGCIASTRLICVNKSEKQTQKEFSLAKKENNKVQDVAATLNVDSGVVKKDMKITMTNLRHKDLPALDLGMTNVTDGVEGYRFLPHGTHFDGDGAVVSLKYDRTKIPSGYTENDIRTYYFDLDTKHWVALKRDSIDKENNLIVSHTNHFTDMINGVIQAPESPETQGFTPTMMSDLKLADPTAKIQSIAPPTANNRGSANLSYSFEMPPARHGMQPSLGIQYNSDGGSGLLGEGWDLSVPTISVETRWGVPRYISDVESETYNMDGSMLVLENGGVNYLAHRASEQIKRAKVIKKDGAVIFHPRKENSFSKIERFGNKPNEYTWVVTDKSGMKYYYGMKDADGNMKGVLAGPKGIAEWKLVRIQEVHGDWVEYEYETKDETVLGNVTAKTLYLSKITAGNSGEKAHTEVAISYSDKVVENPKITTNGRFGFLTAQTKYLNGVIVKYDNEYLRSYGFEYDKSASGAVLLKSVKHLYNKETISENKFEYNDLNLTFGSEESHSASGESGNLLKQIKNGFDGHLSMINGAKTLPGGFSVGGGANAGIGPAYAGANYSFSRNESAGKITLIDITGDGIPDKVYIDGDKLKYCAGMLKGDFAQAEDFDYDFKKPRFSLSKSTSHTVGADVGIGSGWASIGANFSHSWENSQTKVWFQDFNGDGLVDVAYEGKVYFNRLVDGKPSFKTSSDGTPNPVVATDNFPKSGALKETTEEEKKEIQDSLEKAMPMYDAVRVWRAPFSGSVKVSADIEVGEYKGDSKYSDDLNFVLQVGEKVEVSKKLTYKQNYLLPEKTYDVNTGTMIFFRVNSVYHGVCDMIKCDPVIEYTTLSNVDELDENGLSNKKYKASEDFVDGGSDTIVFVGPGSVSVKNTIDIYREIKDTAVLEIKGISKLGRSIIWTDTIIGREEHLDGHFKENGEIFSFDGTSQNDTLMVTVKIKSDVQIDHKAFDWKCEFSTKNVDGVLEKDPDVVAPNRTMYNYIKKETVAKTIEFDDNLEYVDEFATVEFDVTEYEDKNPVFVIFAGENRIKTDSKPLKLNVEELADKDVKIIMYSDSVEQTSQYIANISRDYKETTTNELGEEETVVKTLTIPVSMSVRTIVDPQQLVLGRHYRGWGQFAYKSNPECKRIELDKLTIQSNLSEDEIKEMSEDKGDSDDEETRSSKTLENIDKVENKDQLCFPLSYDSKENIYVGVTPSIYVGANKMQSSRFGDGCVNLEDEIVSYSTQLSGGELRAPILMTKSQTNSGTLTGGASIGKFGIGANGSYSSTTVQTETAAIDLNGDGFPDWVSREEDKDKMTVQYTNENGGLSSTDIHYSFKPQEQKSTATAGGISASLGEKPGKGGAFSAVFTKGMWSKSNLQSMAEADHHATRSASASGNLSKAESNSLSEWYDINGDGLPDLVYDNGNVKLNLGYTFVDATFEKTDIYKAETFTAAAGVGVTIPLKGTASIGVGVNGTMSNTSLLKQLCDINGDGLPDRVENDDNGSLKVHFNTGFGFDSKEHTMSCDAGIYLNKSTSVSVMPHANGGFTFRIGFVSVTPFFNGSVVDGITDGTINRTVRAFSDFDCDGFPDILQSDDANELKVYSSQMGCVDKLKSVTTPFGGKYELEYSHSTPTQQHPGGKWVMSKLTVTDNQRDINDCPPVVSVFDYAGGKRDRRERDFYGFAEVRTKRINGDNKVESQIVQQYDTTNYYTSGTAIGSFVCGASDKDMFSKDTTEYKMYQVSGTGKVDKDNEVKSEDLVYGTRNEYMRIFVAPVKSMSKRFEEEGGGVTVNEVTNDFGNFGNLMKYTYSDGIAKNGYTTEIKYKNYDEETGVFGLPTDVKVESDGNPVRHVSAEYDDSGYNPTSMTKMTQYLDKNTTATIEFKYDTLGNIIEKIMPEVKTGGNLMKKRMTYTYEYDKKHRMYPIRVTDGFGYRSDMFNYDYRYGIPLSVKDMNGFITEYEIDDLGRVTKVTDPNELSAAKNDEAYTIKYEYFSGNKIRMAKTYHYDPQHEDQPMITVNLVDGLGRELQARKSAEVRGNADVMIVSGKTTFDVLGRELSHYAPTTCLKSEMENLTCKFSDLKLDLTTYDIFDRPKKKTVYDELGTEYVTEMKYSIDDNKLKTTVTDPEGLVADAYTDGTEHTLKTVKKHENGGDPATTEFDFDGIGQLLKVTDPAGKFTTYTYDMAGRKLSVDNLSAGKTTFTYDNLGNVLTKTTGKGDVVTYKYEYNRLVEQIYGNDKWKNNVKYTYGGVDAKHNRVGRLALVEDGSGAQEYFYGKMGEVEKIRRTLIIPGIDVATYTTEWKYDSWNRIQEMIYPDGEKIKYYYNLGGQLKKILGQKNYICTYVNEIKYDEYEQRSFIRYGNGTETTYKYEDGLRRLKNMTVANKEEKVFLNNTYSYDKVNNILSVVNAIDKEKALNAEIGGTTSHTYTYDDWHRLKTATGNFNSFDGSKTANYHLEMGYDNLYNITSKKLTMSQTNLQFAGTLSAGHEFSYNYSNDNPMQLASVETKQYNVDRTNMDPNDNFDPEQELLKNLHTQDYEFDDNGNMVSVSVAKNEEENPEGEQEATEEKDVLKSFLWDEENRLLAVNNNGSVSCYFYDAAGERTVKLTSETEMVHVNGKKVGGNDAVTKFTAYVSPYFVVSNGGAYTKHIYAASQRIASKLGNEDGFGADPRRVEMAGGKKISDIQKDNIGARFSELGFTYTAPEKEKVEKDSTMDSEEEEKLIFFYHPDHLGSTSYVTDADGNIAQHIEYIPYGEVFVEERNSQFSTNFLFNAKELDNETGLYYYGARYLDPTGAMWLSVDPMWEKYAGMSPYNYCAGNPVKLVDPDGRDFDENGEKVASQIEKKLHKISAKLDKDYHKSKIEHSEYTNRKSQIEQSLKDIEAMRGDDKITYTYAKAKSGNNGFDLREISSGKVTLRVSKDIGSKVHESRHGGDIARRNLTYETYNVDHEISAYQAQYSVTGSYSFKDLDKINNPDKSVLLNNATLLLQYESERRNEQTGFGSRPAPNTTDPYKTTIKKFGDINKSMIKRITEDGRYPGYNYPSYWYNE